MFQAQSEPDLLPKLAMQKKLWLGSKNEVIVAAFRYIAKCIFTILTFIFTREYSGDEVLAERVS